MASATTSTPDIPGYRMLRPLGEGGMAVVWLAIQESFGREVAIKIMAEAVAARENFSERFLREARIVSRLVHPNIVTVYDVGIAHGLHYLSMEYVPGEELRAVMGRLGARDIVRIVADVARALDYAGRKGFVHRDVKPENILLHEDDERAVLMDFGIARATDGISGMTETGMALGTPHYMSPEQARGRDVDPRSDLYSLGVVLYRLLVGKVPYQADTPVAVGLKHVTDPIPRLPEGLEVFQPVIDSLLTKDPEARCQSGAELVAALDQIPRSDLARADYRLRRARAGGDADAATQPAVPAAASTKRPVKMSARRPDDADATVHRGQSMRATPRARAAVRKPGSGRRWKWVMLALVVLMAGAYYYGFGMQFPPDPERLAVKRAQLGLTGSLPAAVGFPVPDAEGPPSDIQPPLEKQPRVDRPTSAEASVSPPPPESLPTSDSQVSAPPPAVQEEAPDAAVSALLADARALPPGADTIVERARLYREVLQLEPGNQAAASELAALEDDARQRTATAIEAGELERAATSLALAESTFGPALQSEAWSALQNELTQREQLGTLFAEATQRLEANRLAAPQGESAADSYRAVLAIDPDNSAARQGLDAIAARYRQLARARLDQGELDQARVLLRRGLGVNADDSGLLALRTELEQRGRAERELATLMERAQELARGGRWFGGTQDNAAALYVRALKIAPAPRQPEVQAALERLFDGLGQQVREALDSGAFAEAEALLAPARAQFPENLRLAAIDEMVALAKPRVDRLVVSGSADESGLLEQAAPVNADRTLHFRFDYANFSAPTSVLQAILYDGSGAVRIAAVPVVLNGQSGLKQFRIDRPVDGFAPGGYRIELLDGDRIVAERAFVIEN